jgi:subtilisin family serine protease
VKRYGAGLAIILAVIIVLPSFIQAKYLQDGTAYSPNEIVIALKSQYAPITPVQKGGNVISGLSELDALNRQYSVINMWPLFPMAEKHGEAALAGYYSLTFGTSGSLEMILEAYAALSVMEHVEPVGVHRVYYVPNDPSLNTQWAMTTIQARQAWDIGRGDSTVPLGIADTGVDWDHPDLDGNMWYNFDDPIDGVDNDGNGYVDDIRGWDWVNNPLWPLPSPDDDSSTPDNDPMDFFGHGTHVAGIASAETNNSTGIAGLGFKCSIMALRIGYQGLDGNGYVQMNYAASAFYYAANNGAKAVNCSWGSDNSGGISTAASYATSHGVVLVSAAGNDNSSTAPYLCTRSDVIAVAATNDSDIKADFSNYGSWVDVSAPGVNIYSTYFNNTYASMDGTSMAAPHVVGLAGLISAAAPSLTRAQVQTRIINTTDDIDALNPGYANQLGSGRINAASALAGLGTPLAQPILIFPIGSIWLSTPHPTIIWSDTSQATVFHLQVDQHSSFNSTNVNDSTITDTTYYCPDSLADGTWFWRIRAGNGDFWTAYPASQVFRIDSRKPNTTTLLTPALYSWTNNRRPYFTWNAVTDVGGSGISKYFIQIDSDSLFSAPRLVDDSTNTVNYTLNADLPSNGTIYWRVKARDVAGNYGLYATSHFTIDTTPPESPINFGASPHNWTSNPAFTLTWTNPSEPAGIIRALFKVGSAPVSDNDTSGHFAGTPPATYTATATGPTLIYTWLVDAAGNSSYLNRAQDTIKFDNTPPSGSMASSPSESGNLNFNVTWSPGTDIGSGLAGLYDVRSRDGIGGSWVDWRISFSGLSATFSGVHGHTYYFEARARDLAGNLEPFSGNAESQTMVDTTLAGPPFVPGDANGSGDVNGLDIVYLINYLKGIGPPPPDPMLRGDANGSCSVNGVDVTYLLSYLKGGGGPPYAGECKK